MSGTPEIATRAEQPYVAIRAQVTMAELGGAGRPLWGGVRMAGRARPDACRAAVFQVQRHRHGP